MSRAEQSTAAEGERPSKSQRKREHLELQQLAEALLALPESRLRDLPLAERTREELRVARGMSASGSRNRQIRLIAQLLLGEDVEALRAPPRAQAAQQRAEALRHHRAEELRARLLVAGPAALEGLAASEAQRARAIELLRAAHAPTGGPRARSAQRELYRLALALV
jgi:ribosome-associated protein